MDVRRRIGLLSAAAVLLVASCGSNAPQEEQTTALQGSPAPQGAATETTAPRGGGTAVPASPGTPGAQGNVEVAPGEVAVGNVILSLSLQPARHMFEYRTALTTDPTQKPQGSQLQPPQQQQPPRGSAVFGGGMLKVTNNLDPSQNPPADAPEGMLRHVVVQVKDRASGQFIPYVDVSVDVLLDGRPTIFDQALVPMVAVDGDAPQPYYGNNIRFPSRGRYQVFIRLQRHPLLGQDQPPAAQFNVTFH
ncbi:MAG TPA: iron transporter [Chloroflexota bacterium]